MEALPRVARAYVCAVIATGVLCLVLVPPRFGPAAAGPVVFFLLAAALAELRPVAVPEYGVVSVAFATHAAAYVLLPPGTAGAIAALASALADWHTRRPGFKLAFNSAQYYVCATLAGLCYRGFDALVARTGWGHYPSLLLSWLGFSISALVYYVLNVTSVCLAFALSESRSPFSIWLRNFRGYFIQYGALAALGLLVARMFVEEWLSVALLLLPILIVYRGLKNYTDLQLEARETLETLVDILDRRDSYTNQHSQRVAAYAVATARELHLDEDQIEAINLAARVHDLGKVGVTDDLLLKPDALDEREWWVMRQHPVSGQDIASRLRLYRKGSALIRSHHENLDGSGYPDGLVGEAIPLGARIIRVADAYDAMVTDRPYRKGRPPLAALAALRECAGTQFDPAVVEAFTQAVVNRQLAQGAAEAASAVEP